MRQSVPVTAPKPTLQVADLQERLAAVQTMISELDEPLPVETASMLDRLSGLVEQAGETLPPELPAEPPTGTPQPFTARPQSAPSGSR